MKNLLILILVLATYSAIAQPSKIKSIKINGEQKNEWALAEGSKYDFEIEVEGTGLSEKSLDGYLLQLTDSSVPADVFTWKANRSVSTDKKTASYAYNLDLTLVKSWRSIQNIVSLNGSSNFIIALKKDASLVKLDESKTIKLTHVLKVIEVKIDNKVQTDWNFYPRAYSIVSVTLSKQPDNIADKKYVLFIDEVPVQKVYPILKEATTNGYNLTYRFDYSDAQIAAWKETRKTFSQNKLAINVVEKKISVGSEDGLPIPSALQDAKINFVSQQGNAIALIGALFLIGIFIWLANGTDFLRDPQPSSFNAEPGKRMTFSLARVQFAIWNILILYAMLVIYGYAGKYLPITNQLLALIGVSGGQFAIGWAFTKPNSTKPSSGNIFTDMLASDDGQGLHRWQNLLWSCTLWIYFITDLFTNIDYPVLDNNLVLLTGFTAAVYAYGKTQENGKNVTDDRADKVVMPAITTDQGILAALLISNTPRPDDASYVEADAIKSFTAMKAAIYNRLDIPDKFGAPGAKTVTNIITAPNQFPGFSKDDKGNVNIGKGILSLIDDVIQKANAGQRGVYTNFLENAIKIAGSAKGDDPFATIVVTNGKGGTYGWHKTTSTLPAEFVDIPNGNFLGNQFYTIKTTTA